MRQLREARSNNHAGAAAGPWRFSFLHRLLQGNRRDGGKPWAVFDVIALTGGIGETRHHDQVRTGRTAGLAGALLWWWFPPTRKGMINRLCRRAKLTIMAGQGLNAGRAIEPQAVSIGGIGCQCRPPRGISAPVFLRVPATSKECAPSAAFDREQMGVDVSRSAIACDLVGSSSGCAGWGKQGLLRQGHAPAPERPADLRLA